MKRARRKGPYQKLNISQMSSLEVLPRNSEITSNILGLTFLIHSGKKLVSLTIVENMIGHVAGEFVPTREKFEFKKKKKGK